MDIEIRRGNRVLPAPEDCKDSKSIDVPHRDASAIPTRVVVRGIDGRPQGEFTA